VLGVLEHGSEISVLIKDSGCGLVSEPGAYEQVEENIRWFIQNARSDHVAEMGMKGRRYQERYLTKDISVRKYIEAIEAL
jgi:hypothetical protein